MGDSDLNGASVKFPIDFAAKAMTYPLLGARHFTFWYSGEVQVELLGCHVKLKSEKQVRYYPIYKQTTSGRKLSQHKELSMYCL